jgi:hypothetical protein
MCRHLDGNPANNSVNNLCWGTSSDNHEDAVRHGTSVIPPNLKGEDCPTAKLTDATVRELREAIDRGESQRSVARRLGVTKGTVAFAYHRKTWAHVS